MKKGLFTVDQILCSKPEQITILYEESVQSAMDNKEMLITEFDDLSSKELLEKANEAYGKGKENCSIQ